MKTIIYAGIGSRETPESVLEIMFRLGQVLAKKGYTLASGGAEGADKAFEAGADTSKEKNRKVIYLAEDAKGDDAALALAQKFHPNWPACSYYARLLHARNGYIALGKKLDAPVHRILCWTPDGIASGGTGQALRLAKAYDIPVVNLGNPTQLTIVTNWLNAGGSK